MEQASRVCWLISTSISVGVLGQSYPLLPYYPQRDYGYQDYLNTPQDYYYNIPSNDYSYQDYSNAPVRKLGVLFPIPSFNLKPNNNNLNNLRPNNQPRFSNAPRDRRLMIRDQWRKIG